MKIDVEAALAHMVGPEHYRYRECHEEEGVGIYLERFVVVRETPECWWVCRVNDVQLLRWCPLADARRRKWVKRVSKVSSVKHCWPTLDEAWRSYRIRKQYELRRLEHRLDVIQQAFGAMPDSPPDEALEQFPSPGFARVLDCGKPRCHEEYRWG